MKDRAHLLYLQNRVAYARDQAAYKELYLYFHPALYKMAYTILQQDVLAEEVVADVMIRIWTMENKLAYVGHLNTYLLTAARNTAITYLKKHRMETRLPEAAGNGEPMSADTPDQQLMATELSVLIEQTVQALPPQCQMVYRLIKEEELSYKEAGAVLELSQNTLETHMRSALKKLRNALDDYLMKKKS
ncbi:hypothetical protein A8C56_18580 [Niabella ginsenosidivorans]|uniref:RNA polymerase sigma-70 factor n=1 Tax=Niabella ginsenosidivorans TaxID=1176587 RepID=A0A1A9I5U7_9BACT|nr:sigma-70 family RNA polymerase sigma factor [Niabella ginsenosidivorans]ANH82715.1 hypothetical protein A8C56_18580 [Niabella ginsenosidivorans]